ncbi:hypothetical protein PLIIFM63780_002250 [Purpureocillium lilacinum]|nr:hypothetical protein PLIIFM63780_002250 [Purpureocillium lilacinum]
MAKDIVGHNFWNNSLRCVRPDACQPLRYTKAEPQHIPHCTGHIIGTLLELRSHCKNEQGAQRSPRSQDARRLTGGRSSGKGKGKEPTFRRFKNESSLTTYFRTAKELLAYYYRVVYREDGHFTRETEDQVLPRDGIEPTRLQRQAMGEIVKALGAVRKAVKDDGGHGDEEETYRSDPAIRRAIRNFYVTLLYQKVSSAPFRSPLLSFSTMRSRVAPVGGSGGGKGRVRLAEPVTSTMPASRDDGLRGHVLFIPFVERPIPEQRRVQRS